MSQSDVLPYSQYADLLDLHGRSAVSAFRVLRPDSTVPPHGSSADVVAREHLGTLEIWAWMLAHPGADWRTREAPAVPASYEDVVTAVAHELDRLEQLLQEVEVERPIDYFGREGTTYDVARLLAHEAISVAVASSRASGRQPPPLHPEVASDCIDRALAHWSEPQAEVDWSPAPAQLVATDTGRSWWVRFGGSLDGSVSAIARGEAEPSALTVTDSSHALLLWLEGYPDTTPHVDGADTGTYRLLRAALGHSPEPAPRRRWWRRG